MTKLTWGAGHVIGGRYRLIEPLGRGGMGEVWRAEHISLRAPVAVKLIDPQLLEPTKGVARDDVLTRFLHEAQAAAALRSPHVVQILDHGVDEGTPYMTMELLEGETLADWLDRVRVLPIEQTARILAHVARAVGKAHEAGIVHRDLKPENIFLVRNDEEEMAKVLDFGVAKMTGPLLALASGGLVTRSGFLVGTPCYMSPEQAQGKKDLDGRSDLWSIAAIAFECVCGRRPFESESVGVLVLQICAHALPVPSSIAHVPPGFDAWWAKAASREPAERFQTARELVDALRAVLTPGIPFETHYGPDSGAGPMSHAAVSKREATTLRIPSARTERGVVSALYATTGVRAGWQRVALLGAIGFAALLGAAVLVTLARRPRPAAPALALPEIAAGVTAAPTALEPPPVVSPAESAQREPSPQGLTAPAASSEAPPQGLSEAAPPASALAPVRADRPIGAAPPVARPARPRGTAPTPKPKGSQPDRLAF